MIIRHKIGSSKIRRFIQREYALEDEQMEVVMKEVAHILQMVRKELQNDFLYGNHQKMVDQVNSLNNLSNKLQQTDLNNLTTALAEKLEYGISEDVAVLLAELDKMLMNLNYKKWSL